MADFIDFKRIEIGPENLTARVTIGQDAPLYTSEDLEGTTRVYRLLPGIINHVCLGDASGTFKDVMGDTELAHLLEHVTVELLAQTDRAGDITSGRTWAVKDEPDTYDIQLSCPDDVLVIGALSSAAWILQWAYLDGDDPEPDIEAIVDGLVSMVDNLPKPAPVVYEEAGDEDLTSEDDTADAVEIPDFIRSAAEKAAVTDPRRSPEAVQSSQDDAEDDEVVRSDEYVYEQEEEAVGEESDEGADADGSDTPEPEEAADEEAASDDASDDVEDAPEAEEAPEDADATDVDDDAPDNADEEPVPGADAVR